MEDSIANVPITTFYPSSSDGFSSARLIYQNQQFFRQCPGPGNYTRTKCPICGTRFQYGVTSFHYKAAHPEYAAWTILWFKILALLFVPGFIVVVIIGYLVSPTVLKTNPFFAIGLLSYLFGSLIIMLLYRLSVERGFRKTWNDPQWRTEHQKELSSVDVD